MRLALVAVAVAALTFIGRTGSAAPQVGGDAQAGKVVFQNICAVCHGNGGKGDGPGSAALNPKPRNFTDSATMAKIDDATRLKAVTEGGASLGLSPVMPPFKEALSPKQIQDVLAFVKTLAK